MTVALAGNPNCGKTTLFNALTGLNRHVGNFPGVTVEGKRGPVRGKPDMAVVDLPGIYSLRPFSGEEIVARDVLLGGGVDVVLNIVDATSLGRSLYLTLQLLELDAPVVLALNMMDELTGGGGRIEPRALERALGIPVIPISAAKNRGIDDLIEQVELAAGAPGPRRPDYGGGADARCLDRLTALVTDAARAAGLPPGFAAAKLMEGDGPVTAALGLGPGERAEAEAAIGEMERVLGIDRNAALADMRYRLVEELTRRAVVRAPVSRERARSEAIDRVLTHRIWAIPLFLLMMLGIFYLTFGLIGSGLSSLLGRGIAGFTGRVDNLLSAPGVSPVLRSLVVDGVLSGVGTVLGFLPIIVTLFFFLSLLEDSGYLARVAFVLDRLLAEIGLTGRSFVPMLIGFGCTVPAVMAARTLGDERDRRMTILLTPFMSCSAKLPIYAVFTAALFPRHAALVMLGLYILGIALGILCGLVLNRMGADRAPAPFILELPVYRMPGLRSTGMLLWEKARDFITRAFTVIFLASLIIWALETFNYRLEVVADPEYSLLASLGMALEPLFAPLGLADWRVTTALITGLIAKETVLSTLAVLTGVGAAGLGEALAALFTPLSALSFLVFTLLYSPCVAAIAAVRRELGGGEAVRLAAVQCAIAWLAAALVYQVGGLIT